MSHTRADVEPARLGPMGRISNAGTLNRPINIEEVVTTIEKTNRHAAPGENQSITVSIVI